MYKPIKVNGYYEIIQGVAHVISIQYMTYLERMQNWILETGHTKRLKRSEQVVTYLLYDKNGFESSKQVHKMLFTRFSENVIRRVKPKVNRG